HSSYLKNSFKINKTATVVDEILQIPETIQSPVIDGVLDNIWLNVTAHPLLFYCGELIPGSDLDDRDKVFDDHFASFRLLWDEEYFYVFVSVVDDSLYSSFGAYFFINDLIILRFDGGNEKSASFDENDQEWYYVLDKHAAASAELRGRGDFIFLNTEIGYNFELRVHKDSLYNDNGMLFPLQQGKEIGFEIVNADRESESGYRQDWLQWWSDDFNAWRDPSLFGTAVLSKKLVSDTLYIPYSESGSPIIDGIMEEGEGWEIANEITLDKFEYNYRPDNILTTWDDHLSSFWTMWNEDYFYLFAKVTDEELDGSDKISTWANDFIDIFFDGGNEKTEYYDINDADWRYVYGEGPNDFPNRGKGEYVFLDTETGYNFELRIPKDSLINSSGAALFPLEANYKIGFEVSNGDRDGGMLNNVRHWWSSDARTWQYSSLFGTAILIPGQYVIIPPKISSPNGGETWKVGTQHSITWKQNGIDSVKLEYSTNNGITWTTIAIVSTPANELSYLWIIPDTPSEECIVKIISTGDTTIYDISDSVFTIKAPVPHAPTILSVLDVPDDQGGEVYLRFSASDLDTNESVLSYYSIWLAVPGFGWEQIANLPAHHFNEYTYTAETLFDKMPGNTGMHYFLISAHNIDSSVFYDSDIDSGYSVDNIAPGTPINFTASYSEGKIYMEWSANSDPDISGYNLYRGTTQMNVMKFADTENTSYTDENPEGNIYYAVRAVDIHGNLSPLASVLTDVEEEGNKIPSEFALNQNFPNPFNPSTKIRYEIPAESKVLVKIYDVLGRELITLINQYQKRGSYEVEWNAVNNASGIYFYSITAGNFHHVKKMVLIK
ncbi:MAG: sugar-binding protein, partial [Ignavibacteria bacterium]